MAASSRAAGILSKKLTNSHPSRGAVISTWEMLMAKWVPRSPMKRNVRYQGMRRLMPVTGSF